METALINPIEENARKLIRVLVERFPNGATSTSLREGFEADTKLARQSYYYALGYAKKALWIVGGERDPSRNRVVTGSV